MGSHPVHTNMANMISLGLIFTFILSVRGDCPDGYIRYDESCYKFFTSVVATWADALTYCQLFNSKLAVIETALEQTFVEGLLKREYHTGLTDGVWIDGTDLPQKGEWIWADNGRFIAEQPFTKWYPGEPNSQASLGEDCMDLMHHENYNWNDESCKEKLNFLCEMETNSTDNQIGPGNSFSGYCPSDYTRHDDSCYKFFTSVVATWAEASTYCEVFNGKLAEIETDREQTFVEELLKREYHSGLSDGVWIDGTDLLIEGEWVWADSGSPISDQPFSKWYPGEPSSLGKHGEDCLDVMHHGNFSWNDESCERKQNFLCEIETNTGSHIGTGNGGSIFGK